MSWPVLVLIFLGGLVAAPFLFKLLMMLVATVYRPKEGGLILETSLGKPTDATGSDYQSAPSEWERFQGMQGVATTDLRLAGKARLGEVVVDVVSRDEYIEKGEPVVVVEVEGVRVVVARPTA